MKLSLESKSDVVHVTGARFVVFGTAFCFSVLTVGSDMSITVHVGLSVKYNNG